ncbi:hypothetical protein CARUB_v10010156mg [Capsella rubella]|uniref:MADS-box domain-containing protein n=1 Tax=Capsella rubella TaxID=81985 RepID=R0I479_9BRAS|nr:agamous-like MADS-box protein AGL28 [Capsella rubella]EOA37054.1 hypothetical protein CARUB_v10010156mg [Capsella rubella]
MVKNNLGRRKVEMVKMTNETNLQVTFSKRRSGLFKKASELCTLCDANIAILLFSPSGKVFSFGHPDLSLLLDNSPERISNIDLDHGSRNPYLQMLNDRYAELMAGKEREQMKRAMIVQNQRRNNEPDNWWRISTEELSFGQLARMKLALEVLRRKVEETASQFHQTNANYYIGSSGTAASEPVNGGNVSTNQELFHPIYSLPFGFNVMNRTPAGYNHTLIHQNLEFKHPHPYHGPRYY